MKSLRSADATAAPTMSAPSVSMRSVLHPLLRGRHLSIAALVVGSILAGFTEAGVLALLVQIATALVDGASRVYVDLGPAQADATVGALLALGFGLAVARLALQVVLSILPARIAADVQAQLRIDLFSAFACATWGVQSRDREGHLQEVMTNQIGQAVAGVLEAAAMVGAAVTFLVLVAFALALNGIAGLIILVAAVGLFFLLRPLSGFGSRRSEALSRVYLDYAGGVNETIRVTEEAHIFGVGAAQRRRVNDLVVKARRFFFHTQAVARLVRGIYQSLVYILILVALAGLYMSGTGQIASLGAVVLLLARAGTYGQQAQAAYQLVRQALPYLERVQEAQRRYTESSLPPGTQPLDAVRTLVFENVSFAYEPDRLVLQDVNFEISASEAIGIVGPSGAGKSTLVQILLGLRIPDSGRYLVNGMPAQQLRREDWHRRIAYVPQEPRLLHASVTNNIRFLRNLDDDAVERAARLAGIHDDVTRWPDQYNTIVGPRADAISGGQQQRICLARALAAEPEVLVLDEPTSALDPHSELLIQQSLAGLKRHLTLFVVAHRMSTLNICNRVMVIVDGRLEAFDTANALKSSSVYYRSASALSGRGVSPHAS